MSPLLRLSRAFVCAVLLCVLSNVCFAQEPAPASTPAAIAPPARVEVTLTGGRGRAAPELTRGDVRVFVGGVERTVVSFEKEAQPVSYGLLVDNSGSLRSQMAQVVGAAKFIVTRHAPADEAFILRFVASDNVEIRQRLTADKVELHKALDSMYVQGSYTPPEPGVRGGGKVEVKVVGAPDKEKLKAQIVQPAGVKR